MKLYVFNSKKDKIYINANVSNRRDLAILIGSNSFYINGDINNLYHINDVFAENENNVNTTAGVVIGGLIGLIGGPFGVFLGGTLGGIIGNNSDSNDDIMTENFNKSRL